MKEEQKFALLERIRKKAKEGQAFLNEALDSATDETVEIDGEAFERKEVQRFRDILDEAIVAETLESLKSLLKEDTIPFEMLMAGTR